MAKKLNTVLGIDIGTQQIKIAEVKMQGREPAISALGIAPTPPNAADHTGVYDADPIANTIKDLCHSAGVSAGMAVVSITGQASVLVRTLEVPKMNDSELKEHMDWEISRNIPFAESTVVSDYKAFAMADPNAANMDVVMAIAPQSAVDTLVSIVNKAGKKPYAIDVEPLGLARTTQICYGNETLGKTVCVIDIGHLTTSINIYRDGQLQMPRVVPIGGHQFTRALADNLSLPENEAERIKMDRVIIPDSAGQQPAGYGATQGFSGFDPFASNPLEDNNPFGHAPIPMADPTLGPGHGPTDDFQPYSAGEPMGEVPPPAPPVEETPTSLSVPPVPAEDPESMRLYNAYAMVLDEFGSEVRRSIDYFRSRGGEVDIIYITGGGAKMKGLDKFLGRTLNLHVERFDPAKGMNIIAKRLEAGTLEHHRDEFTVAIGNAVNICFD
ncbi:MAG: type IV pilus assembly protein PilM [Armatimonadetes bacterium]|nr:type IV pilus assembly protein PilM [Armatimonadota bacterium]